VNVKDLFGHVKIHGKKRRGILYIKRLCIQPLQVLIALNKCVAAWENQSHGQNLYKLKTYELRMKTQLKL
jgi:hypothetical protein